MNNNTMNNNTMNNNNNNNNDDKCNTMNSSSSSSILVAEAVLTPRAKNNQPGTSSALYKLAARNLREYHGVPSMTALKLEKTVALLGIPPRRLVAQGLAPRRLLKDGQRASSPLVLAGESSDEGKEDVREAETGALDVNFNNYSNSSSSEDEEEEDDSNSSYDDINDNVGNYSGGDTRGNVEGFEADDISNGKARRPIHDALVAGGINLRPRETRPLLRALGISPHRLVKLGLVKREALHAMPGGRRGGPGQRPRPGGPSRRGVSRPRGPPHGPPHVHHCCGPSFGGGPFGPMQEPPRHPCRGAGHHTLHLGAESEEEGMPAPLGPHGGPGHRGPRHQGGRLLGSPHRPGHLSNLPTVRHGRGPPGGGEYGHGHGHHHPPHGHGHGHEHGHEHGHVHGLGHVHVHVHDGGDLHGESEGEGGNRLHGGAGGPGQHGPRHPGGGGMGSSRGRPRGPSHGPPHGPFHGLFHEEGAYGAPPGMMAHPNHGLPSRGGGGMKQRGSRQGGGMRYCGGRGGGGGGDGGGGGSGGGDDMKLRKRARLAQFDGRHQPQLEAC